MAAGFSLNWARTRRCFGLNRHAILDCFNLTNTYGVAEPGLEPVVRAEQGEQAGPGGRAVGVAVPHAGGVVERHDPGRHARPLEHLQQTLAHAFRGLARQRHHPAHVRIRERHRQKMHDPFHARDHGPGLAEIDLRASRRPLQIGETARLSSMLLPPTLDPTLHRRIPAFRHEPLVHAGRGMALLDGHAQIGGRPALHDGRVPSSTSDLPGRAVVDDLGE